MPKKTKQRSRSGGLGGGRKATQKQLRAEGMQSAHAVPETGKWKYHPLYRTWRNIKCRCYTPSNKDYKLYGARGIKVCERWKDFVSFAVDMWPRPTPHHTIDRMNSNGNYAPGNCRWATRTEQNLNTSQNHFLEHNGMRRTMSEWARDAGISQAAFGSRIKCGWSVERALTEPLNQWRNCA